MTEIFIFGTLCHRPLLDLVAGEALEMRAAVLPDAEVVHVAGASWPMLHPSPGSTAPGFLIHPSPAALARLDFYEACFDYSRIPAEILVDGAPRAVEIWRPSELHGTPGAPWHVAPWAETWGALTVLAAEEVMRQSLSATPQEVGARFWMIRARAHAQLRSAAWQRPATIGARLTRADVDVEKRAFPYDKFFTVEELTIRARQFDGTRSGSQSRAVFHVADAVTVLPYDPVRDRILLIEQLRLGCFAHGDPDPWILEPIAGMIDAGESEADSAHREAQEEAGLTLQDLHFVARYYPSPGGIAQVLSSYVATAELPDGVTGTHGIDGEGEDILSHLVEFDHAVAMLASGEIANAPLILSLQWLQLNRDQLRRAG